MIIPPFEKGGQGDFKIVSYMPNKKNNMILNSIDLDFVSNLRPFFQFLYHIYFRVEVVGSNNLPSNGPAIIVVNHAGGLPYDGAMIHLAIFNNHPRRRIVRFLVDDFAFDLPVVGNIIQRLGGVKALYENASLLLGNKDLVVIFPEGVNGVGKEFEKKYKLGEFGRGGFVRLAIEHGVPVIPTVVIGSEEIHPIIWKSRTLGKIMGVPYVPFTPTFPWLGLLGLVPLPSKWKIVFGKLIYFDKHSLACAKDEGFVKKEAGKIRTKMQAMIDKEIIKRKNIWV